MHPTRKLIGVAQRLGVHLLVVLAGVRLVGRVAVGVRPLAPGLRAAWFVLALGGTYKFSEKLGVFVEGFNGQSAIGANSNLPYVDYVGDPTRNNMPIAFRRVAATRLSGELEQPGAGGRLSVLGFFRDNAMDLNGTYNLITLGVTTTIEGQITKAKAELEKIKASLKRL